MTEDTVLRVNKLKKEFGGLVAVQDVSFEIKSGDNVNTLIEYAGKGNNAFNNQAIIARSNHNNLYLSKSDFNKTSLINGDSLIFPIANVPPKSISISTSNNAFTKITF